MFRALVIVQIGLIVLVAALFALWPDLDVRAARAFVGDNGLFIGVTPVGTLIRGFFYAFPLVLAVVLLGVWIYARWRTPPWPAPSGRAILFMALALALGPGLLVNGILKEISHRPRPFHAQEVHAGGFWPFRPWNRFDGKCESNCSFVSGEASSAMWTLAPALLTPPPVRLLAVAGSFVLTAATGVWRMAFGGHFLSDVILAALFTSLLISLLWHWMIRRPELRASPQG